ncbi:nuclear movement protein nudC [Sugiyamaella lignohabitans]|uniref:Nuclear movement protein nudC n=1 Tax=Sugiyamaella lignohabitans TaxID=796027 RepID=A0A170QYF1_9ASCO|nr:nuclear movement protein nudC [Sugiyamaella lignohabitans]ANB15975.1 nuclear movement protein nudC [Sugiyamaella lignohabitans]
MAAHVPKYTFKQTLEDVTVTIPLSAKTRAKFVNVKLGNSSIEAALKSTPDDYLIKGTLFNEIIVDESTWSVVDQEELVFNLEKVNKTEWWPHVVTTDPKIDVTKIQPENSKLSDLDDETRGMVEKMMFDQKQKQAGLPSSDELKKRQTLEKFKAMHPELDFSKVDMNNI